MYTGSLASRTFLQRKQDSSDSPGFFGTKSSVLGSRAEASAEKITGEVRLRLPSGASFLASEGIGSLGEAVLVLDIGGRASTTSRTVSTCGDGRSVTVGLAGGGGGEAGGDLTTQASAGSRQKILSRGLPPPRLEDLHIRERFPMEVRSRGSRG